MEQQNKCLKMEAISKYFTTHKRGEREEDNQDSVCINKENGRYTLSDGVSQSFLPRLLADILTESFVAASNNDIFPDKSLPEIFQKRKNEYISSLDEFGASMQEIAEETFKGLAAATFVGLEIHEQHVVWKVIGDSCLFIIPDDGTIQCVCSEDVNIDANGSIHVAFGTTPAQIQSDGKIYGEFITGQTQIKTGWYILMSDAISDWFIKEYNNNKEKVIEQLFQLKDNAEFECFIEKEFRSNRIKNDDCSVILIRIENGKTEAYPQKDEPGPDYFNDVEKNDLKIKALPRNILVWLREKIFKNKEIAKIQSEHKNNDYDELHTRD